MCAESLKLNLMPAIQSRCMTANWLLCIRVRFCPRWLQRLKRSLMMELIPPLALHCWDLSYSQSPWMEHLLYYLQTHSVEYECTDNTWSIMTKDLSMRSFDRFFRLPYHYQHNDNFKRFISLLLPKTSFSDICNHEVIATLEVLLYKVLKQHQILCCLRHVWVWSEGHWQVFGFSSRICLHCFGHKLDYIICSRGEMDFLRWVTPGVCSLVCCES